MSRVLPGDRCTATSRPSRRLERRSQRGLRSTSLLARNHTFRALIALGTETAGRRTRTVATPFGIALLLICVVGCSADLDDPDVSVNDIRQGEDTSPITPEPDAEVAVPKDGVVVTVRYLRHPTSVEGREAPEWTPARGVQVELIQGDAVTGRVLTNAEGRAVLQAQAGPVSARITARAKTDRVDIEVRHADGETPWTAEVDVVDNKADVDVEDVYLSGALNVVGLMHDVADVIAPLGAMAPEMPLIVRWDDKFTPGCGSCFFDTTFRLDLGGAEGEWDAHDDPVVLHELGHFAEAAYGYYSNQGGFHDLQPIVPTLAWSEGFATWFATELRGDPDYTDVRPGGFVYHLDVANPPDTTKGVQGDGPTAPHSEALVYGLLWDLREQLDQSDRLWAALSLTADADLSAAGADLVDYLNRLRCLTALADGPLATALETYEFPYGLDDPPVCQ